MENPPTNPPSSSSSSDPSSSPKILLQSDAMEKIMTIDASNRTCIDCNSCGSTYISINHGITLCSSCIASHRSFGNYISYLVPLSGPWDSYLLDFVLLGGNSKFASFFSQRKLEFSSVHDKYNSKACDFYRRNLKSRVMRLGELKEDFDNGAEVGKFRVVFPEFESYTINLSELEGTNKFVGFFKNIGEKIKAQANVNLERISHSAFGMKVKEAGENAGEQLKKGVTFVKERTESLGERVKETVSGIANRKKEGKEEVKEEKKEESKEEGKDEKIEGKEDKNATTTTNTNSMNSGVTASSANENSTEGQIDDILKEVQ